LCCLKAFKKEIFFLIFIVGVGGNLNHNQIIGWPRETDRYQCLKHHPGSRICRPLDLVYLVSVSLYTGLAKSVEKRNYERCLSMWHLLAQHRVTSQPLAITCLLTLRSTP